ncbi:MAG: acyl-[acyl-carrier-protein]--UDP-N-acetylglucosamine O-acyltransferase [Planctomycetales bacterium 4572_13]|nr:MAG: acyl-[acyl-carrier-protein]--UDP-N-acetylglucosamine O-acyltransferase [Planctomycetales bacterium 4572_13]
MSEKIHPTAVIASSAQIGSNVTIGPYTVVDDGAVVGDNTVLDTHVVIGKNVKMGVGNRVLAGAVIGRPPQILGFDDDTKMGGLQIGDNNVLREYVTVHPSMFPNENTIIGNGNLLMINVHLGHDCVLEDEIIISNATQVSGHCKLEMGVWLAGNVLIHQFVTIGKWCYAAGLTGINHDVPPFVIVSGHYPMEVRAVNKRGLARAGLTPDQQKEVFRAFKYIWRNNGPILERAKQLAEKGDLEPPVQDIVDVLIRGGKQRFGRHLELFRD